MTPRKLIDDVIAEQRRPIMSVAEMRAAVRQLTGPAAAPRAGSKYVMFIPDQLICLRCGQGVDDDGDGNCKGCARIRQLPIQDSEFALIIRRTLQYSHARASEFANHLGVSTPDIILWLDGESAPIQSLREPILLAATKFVRTFKVQK